MSKRIFLPCGLLVLGMLAFGACKITTTSSVIATQTAQAEAVDAAAATAVAATLAAHPTADTAGTVEAAVKATQTAQAAPTPTPQPPPTSTVAFISCHGWYMSALSDGTIKQVQQLGDCGWFTLQRLGDGEVALVTCYNTYVTAPISGVTGLDWMLRQEPGLSACGRFSLHDLDRGRVAFETCAGRYATAGDASWEPGLQWAIIAQTYRLDDWEIFTMLRP